VTLNAKYYNAICIYILVMSDQSVYTFFWDTVYCSVLNRLLLLNADSCRPVTNSRAKNCPSTRKCLLLSWFKNERALIIWYVLSAEEAYIKVEFQLLQKVSVRYAFSRRTRDVFIQENS
jgi:hypothetical protein